MNPLLVDVIFVVCALGALFFGYRKGLVGQVVWFFSSIIGFALGARFAADLAVLLQYRIVSKPVTIAVCFLALFLAVNWLTHWIGAWLTRQIQQSLAGTVNSALGAVFNLALYIVIASLITLLSMLVIPNARETVQQTTVLNAAFEPIKAFIDDRILHHNETGNRVPGTET
ncbi:MAG: CvpA family protein [candidate division Zixibacteria bacterium]|nr:CvpA family protein [candidate division Zixibacteria bacterium]